MSLAKQEALALTKAFGVHSLALIDALLAHAERDASLSAQGRHNNEDINEDEDSGPAAAMAALLEVDSSLQRSLVREEQAFYDEIVSVKQRIVEKEAEVSKLIGSLQKAERRLQGLLNTSTETMESITLAQKNPVDIETLINYAARIGGVMRGPTKDESEVLEYVIEPFPNMFHIHRSRLYSGDYIARDAVSEEKQRKIEQLTADNRFNRIVSRPQELVPAESGVSLFHELDPEPRSHPGSAGGGLFADLDDPM